jgi:hypothetical protein
MKTLSKLWKNYSLSIVLLSLFLLTWTSQFFVQLQEVKNEAIAHGQAFQWGDFWTKFWSSTLENWQSEFLQLLTFVVLTTYLIHKNSHESRDSDERFEKKLDQIIDRLSKRHIND